MFFTDYQSMSLKLHSRKTSVRFCLSNGRSWIFVILEKGHNGERTYYESAARHLNKDVLQTHNEGALHLKGCLLRNAPQFWISMVVP
jgi:hypothetical protein